jgi:chromate transporter
MDDRPQWALAVICFFVTVILQAEVALLFVGAGVVGIFYYGSLFRRLPPASAPALADRFSRRSCRLLRVRPSVSSCCSSSRRGRLRSQARDRALPPAGSQQEHGWLDERQFLIAVAVGMISPGPVVVTATFVGYLVAGFRGSLVSTVNLLPFVPTRACGGANLARHRRRMFKAHQRRYAAAIGTVLGACILLGRIAIGDWLTVAISISSLPFCSDGGQQSAVSPLLWSA